MLQVCISIAATTCDQERCTASHMLPLTTFLDVSNTLTLALCRTLNLASQ